MKESVDLDAIFDRFHAPKKPIFKERDFLRATYVPTSLPHRGNEIRGLANILGPIMAGGTPSNAFLYGKPGGGKTVVTKYVINRLHKKAGDVDIKFEFAFINCQMVDTAYRVYAALCEAVNVEVPITGLSTDLIFDSFCKKLDEEPTVLTIILDEVDLLMKTDNKVNSKKMTLLK
ncbi:MAG: AAA family ATPase [Candidatus Heimdallarchaeota archaeon]|nr:AAA family ATPase [Candidatus Heimdallarchaeota archaeon]